VVTYSDESGQFQLVTGANDGYIKVCTIFIFYQLGTHVTQMWNIEPPKSKVVLDGGLHRPGAQREVESTNGWRNHPLSPVVLPDIISARHNALRSFKIYLNSKR
jgi:hypothetical protein